MNDLSGGCELQVRAKWALALITELVQFGRTSGWLDGEPLGTIDTDALLDETVPMPSPMGVLGSRFELSHVELDLLWLLACIELDPHVSNAALLLVPPGMTELSAQVIERLVGHGEALDYDIFERLESLALIQSDPRLPLNRRPVRVHERILDLVRGQMRLDRRMSAFAVLDDELHVCGAPRPEPTEAHTARIRSATATNALLIFSGAPGVGRRTFLRLAAIRQGFKVLEIDCSRLSRVSSELRGQATLIARECRLFGRVPLLANIDALEGAEAGEFARKLDANIRGAIFATCASRRPPLLCWRRPTVLVEVGAPTTTERATLWKSKLGAGTHEDAEFLATQYPLAPALIHHAANAARARAEGRDLTPEDIHAGIRAVLDDKLGDYARRVEVTQTWDDLVLPEEQLEAVQYLIARIRQRRTVYEQWGFAAKVGKGLGTSALLSGPPGTGKTMVAALIAKELGLELYQVDMAKITSKYIGETERNLAALFDAAEAGHAVLLFDEADSLFGKRTEVKSSNDRYANLETNYLLQRLESFTGICLLTSNHESNIDPAFQRRLSLHVRFDLPEIDERAALWRAMLPAAAPVAANVDFTALAQRFVMSGGYIRNAALRAAFLAADEGSVITASLLDRAAKLEYEAMGKVAFQMS